MRIGGIHGVDWILTIIPKITCPQMNTDKHRYVEIVGWDKAVPFPAFIQTACNVPYAGLLLGFLLYDCNLRSSVNNFFSGLACSPDFVALHPGY